MKQLSPGKASETQDVLSSTLQLCGDAHVMLAHNQAQYKEYSKQFEMLTDIDVNIVESAQSDLNEFSKYCKDFWDMGDIAVCQTKCRKCLAKGHLILSIFCRL